MRDRDSYDDLMTKREFADELRISTRTVERYIDRGEISAQKIGKAGRVRIRRTELARLLSPQSSPSQGDTTDAQVPPPTASVSTVPPALGSPRTSAGGTPVTSVTTDPPIGDPRRAEHDGDEQQVDGGHDDLRRVSTEHAAEDQHGEQKHQASASSGNRSGTTVSFPAIASDEHEHTAGNEAEQDEQQRIHELSLATAPAITGAATPTTFPTPQ